MTNMIRIFALASVISLLAATGPAAQVQDAAGSKDHPLIPRYPGAIITKYVFKELDEYVFPLGKLQEDTLEKSQTLEGKVTRIIYQTRPQNSVLQIYRYYETVLVKSGFVLLFACKKVEECGSGKYEFHPSWIDYWGYSGQVDYRHLSAKLVRPRGDVYVNLYVADDNSVNIDVIETNP